MQNRNSTEKATEAMMVHLIGNLFMEIYAFLFRSGFPPS
jgi:hypothetical protein